MTDAFDVAIIGGGHNGLTAAAYLAKADKRVIVLERQSSLGGAATSSMLFEGVDANLSQYAHLVHLLPQRIIDDLGLSIRFAPRRHAAYAASIDSARGLLIDLDDAAETTAAFAAIGALDDAAPWRDFMADATHLGARIAATLCDPLPTRSQARALVADDRVWNAFIEHPIASHIERSVRHDLVRGLLGSTGHFSDLGSGDTSGLAANRAVLHRMLGAPNGGALPIGGMGALSGELARVALLAGASLTTNAEVIAVTPEGELQVRIGNREQVITARWVLADVASAVLDGLLQRGIGAPPSASPSSAPPLSAPPSSAPSSSAPPLGPPGTARAKVNLLLTRLPQLRDGADVAAAFGGTMHINQGWQQLQRAAAPLPSPSSPSSLSSLPRPLPLLPLEITCHTLADSSILGPELRERGVHSLSILTAGAPGRAALDRADTQRAMLASLESALAEPLEPLLLPDANGEPCVHTRTSLDLALDLGAAPADFARWPFADDELARDTPAQRWGVATEHARVLLCGAASQRGGSVSGIAGHNAAMAVLEADPAG